MRFVFAGLVAIAAICLLTQGPSMAQTGTLKNAIGMEFVKINAGEFMMGCSQGDNSCKPEEKPQHQVRITKAFEMGRYEVTQAQWKAVMNANQSDFVGDNLPVENVTRAEAIDFANRLTMRNDGYKYRLPTEAEWETAARGASPASRFWANWTVDGLANLKNSGTARPVPVGQFIADVSPFGAYDMAGNVHEWVNDRYSLYKGNPASLEGSDSAKVVRGGSFALSPPELSPSWRASLDPSITPGKDSPVGFRCAADPLQSVTRPRAQLPQ